MQQGEKFGVLSLFSLIVLLVGITIVSDVSYANLITNILDFWSGDFDSVPDGSDENLRTLVTNFLAILVIEIVIALFALIITLLLNGLPSRRSDALWKLMERGPLVLFLLVLGEEAFARLPLVLVAELNNNLLFYIVAIGANTVWALLHLGNHEARKRNLTLVLPQFLGGLILIYVFVRYGFFVALMSHFLFNVLVLSMLKKQKVSIRNFQVAGYYGVIALIGLLLISQLEIGFDQISPWIESNREIQKLEAISFWEYLLLLITVNCICEFVAGLILLDHSEPSRDVNPLVALLLGIPIFIGMVLLGNILLEIFFDEPLFRASILTVGLSLMSRTRSGSALARVFFTNLPVMFLLILIITTQNIFVSAGLIGFMFILDIVPRTALKEVIALSQRPARLLSQP